MSVHVTALFEPEMHLFCFRQTLSLTFCRDGDNDTIAALHKVGSGRVHCGHLIQAALEIISACVLLFIYLSAHHVGHS